MEISDRKALVNQKLKEMGYGARKLLADHCGVDYRQVGRWISLETTDWPKLENEIKLAEFLKINPQVFHAEEGIELAKVSQKFSEDVPRILAGIRTANEKLDGLTTQLREAGELPFSKKELLWIAPTVLKLQQEIKRLNDIPEMPELRGLAILCEDLEQRLSAFQTQGRAPG